ncbi:hypothetical protein JY651_50390 [Pyxidicoccus parkwayensis]|uniref:Uncharacterized protein n=1 Tax=Pyxidicoccus parkwayensis TaxID=2813578 RepID=A0ABX7NXM0_9BACT|nr:hypothetical protein [Pyxidicoccus parkwaysis]QSQ23203.1 hypothetical protein JY651_50390 [Pyxidicoccus parkwaysis]
MLHLRVDLSARREPAALAVDLPRKDVSIQLLEGDVPMPETWERFAALTGFMMVSCASREGFWR